MTAIQNSGLHEALGNLRRHIPRVADSLGLDDAGDLSAWTGMVDRKLLPRTAPDFPLIATICGGGSSGKSTLFNALAGEPISPSGGRAGMNRRVLISARRNRVGSNDYLKAVFEPFGTAPEPMKDRAALLTQGEPLYVLSDSIPENLILVDTPDFDTGAQGIYANREAAAGALETADVLIYIFTNSNYNNRDNTDFISSMLTGIGRRKCFLVYRVYPSFETEEVLDHANTVARNLYGSAADKYVLGIYRVDDDNEVAAGRQPMTVKPVLDGHPTFAEALGRLDHRRVRMELMSSILEDVIDGARRAVDRSIASRDRLALYLEALETAQARCVQEALRHFPMDRVMGRFSQIWLSSDPPHIRAMRKTGKVLDFPVRALVKSARWARRKLSASPPPEPLPDAADSVADDLLRAANRLHRYTLEEEIVLALSPDAPLAARITSFGQNNRIATGPPGPSAPRLERTDPDGRIQATVPAHPAAAPVREAIRQVDWTETLDAILSQKELLTTVSKDIDRELAELVRTFREKMGFWEQTQQTFSAFLNVLPATVAVTYILSTGDPVGAAGIKVKLTGLFGLHDIYALVALPATTGLKKADLNQLEHLLGPIAQAWLSNKLQVVEALFEKRISGALLERLRQALKDADRRIEAIEAGIDRCEKGLATT